MNDGEAFDGLVLETALSEADVAALHKWMEAQRVAHRGMMTRRAVLARWAFVDLRSWENPGLTGYSLEAYILRDVLGARGVHRRELAHEIALMMHEEVEVECS